MGYMNFMDSHSQVEKGVTFVSCRIYRLLFADDLVLLWNFLNRVLSMYSIGFPLRVTEPE